MFFAATLASKQGTGKMQSAIKSLVLTARQHGKELSEELLHHDYGIGEEEASDDLLVKIASENDLKAQKITIEWQELTQLNEAFPIIARLKSGQCVIVTGYRPATDEVDEHVLVINTLATKPEVEIVNKESFLAQWNGSLVLLKREYRLMDEDQPFSFGWITARFLKQKALLGQLVFIAFVLHAFAVLPAIFIMIVLDKVVNYQSTSTLAVIAAGVIIAYVFNGILSALRQYIILFATSKVDVRLSSDVFNKLLNLPLSFFKQQPVSTVASTVQQTNTLRQVLTGRFFAVILDSTSLLVFIPILILYSPLLCAIVFTFATLISLNNYVGAKVTKSKMINASQAEGNKQSVLTSSLAGIETIKSLALEPGQKQAWEGAIAGHVVANLELGKLNAITSQISATLQQLMTVAVISIGCLLVFSGDLSAGVLIGVNMMAGKVTGPLVQLAGLAGDFEKVKNAVDSLSPVMNSRGESVRRGLVTDIFGSIEFKDVSFKYEDGPLALDRVSFKIQARQRVGIVGQSGSGQSTLARHIQGLLKADEGTITIDDQDIRSLDLGHLRINVAAVSQDSSFFKATIRENILKPSPNAAMARVLWASKMVGLHEDVEQMSDGYETLLEEGGLNITEVIRQKIAIARALIRNPKILILDDAVAGFDMESELALRERMDDINRGRTLILISNYVSKIANSDLILVMDKGKVVQSGAHDELVAQEGLYQRLYQMERALVDPKLSTSPKEQVA